MWPLSEKLTLLKFEAVIYQLPTGFSLLITLNILPFSSLLIIVCYTKLVGKNQRNANEIRVLLTIDYCHVADLALAWLYAVRLRA